MIEVSVFNNYSCFDKNKPLFNILTEIKHGTYKNEIDLVRDNFLKGDKTTADFYKNQLPAFTPSGTFDNGRRASLLVKYNQLIILDLDKLKQTDLDQAKSKAIACPHTLAAFISPSGNGLKIIVPINSNAEQHKEAFTQVASFYQELLSLKIDQSGKDVSRLCFMSYDSKCYINEQAEAFNVNIVCKQTEIKEQTKPKPCIQVSTEQTTDWQSQFEQCVKFTENKEGYYNGNRNNFIHLLACNCNRAGIPQHIAESNMLANFDLEQKEIITIINSAYSNTQEFASTKPKKNDEEYHFYSLENMIERANKEPPKSFIWSSIMVGSFGFVFGPSKSGKTILCENLALSIAAGKKAFLGIEIENTNKRVIFISLEEFWQNRTNRNKTQLEYLNVNLKDNFSVVDEKFPRYITCESEWDILKQHIIKSKAEVVFIDSLGRLQNGKIEESSNAQVIALKLRELANSLKITLIVIHHTPKQNGRALTIDSLAGSRILGQEADFLIGVNKSPSGVRYMKEIASRYKPENDEYVSVFSINDHTWLELSDAVSEASILRNNDGRVDETNTELILNFIQTKTTSPQTYVHSSELIAEFVSTKYMSKATLYNQLKKLEIKGSIFSPSNSIYKSKVS